MLVFGAIDFAAALARQGSFLGYRVTVCDARAVFATPARFPTADDVVVAWPHRYLAAQAEAGGIDERTVICVLTTIRSSTSRCSRWRCAWVSDTWGRWDHARRTTTGWIGYARRA